MKRALRLDKVRLAMLEATLKLYTDPEKLRARLPTIRTLARKPDEMRAQAERLLPAMAKAVGEAAKITVEPANGQIGSGALPVEALPSFALALRGKNLDRLADAFRRLPIPVIGYIRNDTLLFDMRTLDDEAAFAAQLSQVVLP